jgi:hypothetical protein
MMWPIRKSRDTVFHSFTSLTAVCIRPEIWRRFRLLNDENHAAVLRLPACGGYGQWGCGARRVAIGGRAGGGSERPLGARCLHIYRLTQASSPIDH